MCNEKDATNKPRSVKSKQFAFILYPDSMNVDPMYLPFKMLEHGYVGAISPLHTPSNNPIKDLKDEEKKPHYHVIVVFEYARSEQMLQKFVTEELNGTFVKAIASRRLYTRYLRHLDNPEKEQFEKMSCSFGDFNLEEYELQCSPLEYLVEYLFEHEDVNSIRKLTQHCMKYFKWALPYIRQNAYYLSCLMVRSDEEDEKK